MKKSLILIAILSIFGASMLFAAGMPKGDIQIKKTGSSKGSVTFNHDKHKKLEVFKKCADCHNAVKSKSDAHKLCMVCHAKTPDPTGPKKCSECHKK